VLHPFVVVSLADVLKITGVQLWPSCTFLASTLQHLKLHRSAVGPKGLLALIDDESFDQIGMAVTVIGNLATQMGMISPKAAAFRSLDALEAVANRWPRLSAEDLTTLINPLSQLLTSFADEMEGRVLMVMHPQHEALYEAKEPLFGREVFDAFPSAHYDISEAGSCLAVGRATACVMLSMRVMEAGLATLAATLNIHKQNDWGAYLRKIEKELDGRAQAAGA
jgi:hypothetical protein